MSKVIGSNIVTAREAAGIRTQSELARRAGVPQPQMNDWEKGRFTPDVMNLLKIAAAIPCSVELLVAGADTAYDESRAKAQSQQNDVEDSSGRKTTSLTQKGLSTEVHKGVDSRAEELRQTLYPSVESSSHETSHTDHDRPADTGIKPPDVDLTNATADLQRTLAAVRDAAKRLGIDIATVGLAADKATGRDRPQRDRKPKPERARDARRGRR